MIVYDTYGFDSGDIVNLRIQIERATGFQFNERENSVYGTYYRQRIGLEIITLHRNWDEEEATKLPGYPEGCGAILLVERTERGDELKAKLEESIAGTRFLSRHD